MSCRHAAGLRDVAEEAVVRLGHRDAGVAVAREERLGAELEEGEALSPPPRLQRSARLVWLACTDRVALEVPGRALPPCAAIVSALSSRPAVPRPTSAVGPRGTMLPAANLNILRE